MKYKKRLTKSFSYLLIILLIISSFPQNPNATESIGKTEILKKSGEYLVDSKISNLLEEQEYVDVLIELKEQIDTRVVAENITHLFTSKIKKSEQELKIRTAIVEKLKTHANKSQKEIVEQLDIFEATGEVKNVKSFYIVNMVAATVSKNALEVLAQRKDIVSIHLDDKIAIDLPTRSANTTSQPTNTDNIEWGVKQIGAPEVWQEYGVDGQGVVVGLIDSGVSWEHEALKEKWRGYDPNSPNNPNPAGNWFDAVNGESLPYDIASSPHGSHVLGTILGQDPAGENKIGVAPGAQWIAAKAFTADGGQDSWLLAAGQFMLAPNGDPLLAPDVINNSWGGQPGRDDWYRTMVQAWRNAGILPVFSGGNKGPGSGTVAPPSNYPESYAVAATDINNKLGDFSSRGPGPYAGDQKPDLSAPGVNIRSSVPTGYEGGWNGTSMAAPHVTGTAALLLSVDSTLTVNELEELMDTTADRLTDSKYTESPNDGYGIGLVNAYEAVSSVAIGMGAVQGTVLKEGTDNVSPEIVHEPVSFGYVGLDITLEAEVSDNISVVKTELLLRKIGEESWESVSMKRVSGDYKLGAYQVSAPQAFLTELDFEYKIKSTDFSGNITETSIYNVDVSYGIKPSDSFETDFTTFPAGFEMTGDWQWGEPTYGPKPVKGKKYVATILDGNYSYGSNSTFSLPPIDVRDMTQGYLRFDHYFDIQYLYDFGRVLVSTDAGETWEVADEFTGRERAWDTFELDLSPYAGNTQQLLVKLQFDSDANEEFTKLAGWHIDYVSVTDNANTLLQNKDTKKNENVEYDKQVFGGTITTNEVVEALPVEAKVTVVETGRSTSTSLENGSFTLFHGPTPENETYTLKVEAFGYHTEEVEFTLLDGEIKDLNFLLEEFPQGEINGTVIHATTKEPIEGIEVQIKDNQDYLPTVTSATGTFSFQDVLEGNYELEVEGENYFSQDIAVKVTGDNTTTVSFELTPFPGEVLAFDDGTAENARAFNQSGYGTGVRMTAPSEVTLDGMSVFLFDESWPYPGGTNLEIAVYDQNELGQPGKLIAEPLAVTGIRGEWNYFDLTTFNFETDGDFYVFVMQTDAYPYVPGIGIDTDGEATNRSYYVDNLGEFTQHPASDGNYMLRGHVSEVVAITPPVLLGPNTVYTNEETVLVQGEVEEDSEVLLFVDGIEKENVPSENLTFESSVSVAEGENLISAKAKIGENISTVSNIITVIKDTEAPVLTITEPQDELYTSKSEVIVSGRVVEDHLDFVTVMDNTMKVDEDGNFTSTITLTKGVNNITVHAVDLAGNETSLTIQITLDTEELVLTNITPSMDQFVKPGSSVRVAFNANKESAQADVTIYNQFGKLVKVISAAETEGGLFEAEWVIPSNTAFGSYSMEISFTDLLGNEVTETLKGEISVIEDSIDREFGNDRYATAVEISKKDRDSTDVVVLVRGDHFADALAGVPLAYKVDAPILLTRSNRLVDVTKDEINRLNPSKVIILGGTGAVSEAVVKELLEINNSLVVERVFGATKYETAKEISELVAPNGHDKAIIVSGENFPDALSVAPFAATAGIPILLSSADRLPAETREAITSLGAVDTLVIGGIGAISNKAVADLPSPERLFGDTRYETNVAIMDYFGPLSNQAYVATGTEFADAITGALLAARNNSGMLLVKNNVPVVVSNYIKLKNLQMLTLFGGAQVISESTENSLRTLLP